MPLVPTVKAAARTILRSAFSLSLQWLKTPVGANGD